MSPSNMISFIVSFSFLRHPSVTAQSLPNDTLGLSDLERNCFCYKGIEALSCHCERKIHVEFRAAYRVSITLKCVDGAVLNPYRYLSLVDIEHFVTSTDSLTSPSLEVNILGCLPPQRSYTALGIRRGERMVSVSEAFSRVSLRIECGSLRTFHLESSHFEGFNSVFHLEIHCPVVSHLPGDLFADTYGSLQEFEMTNTAIDSTPIGLFSRFNKVWKLIIPRNKIRSIHSLQGLERLTYLDAKDNGLQDFPEDIFEPTPHMRAIEVEQNLLTRLPESLCGLKNLWSLKATNNQIQYVRADCFTGLFFLEEFYLEGNQLRSLECTHDIRNAIISLVDLRTVRNDPEGESSLDTSPASTTSSTSSFETSEGNPLPSTEEEDCHFLGNKSRQVILRNNSIRSIPRTAFSRLSELDSVDLSFNTLSHLPRELFQHNALLKRLTVSNNFLTNVSDSMILKNEALKFLDMSSNRLRTLGENFFSATTVLEHVDLSHNSIDNLPSGIFIPLNTTKGTSYKGPGDLVLNLEGNLLSSLPLLPLPRLTDLNLANNNLSHLPADTLRQLSSLIRIDLSRNKIHDTDSSLFSSYLGRISTINLSHNRLSSHPNVRSVMGSLRSLNLSGNHIDNIRFHGTTTVVYWYEDIEVLDLSRNYLQQGFIPKFGHLSRITSMRKVKHLDLSWNGLILGECLEERAISKPTRCVKFLSGSTDMEVLLMSHNEIQTIPVYFQLLPKLRLVDLSHNRIKVVSLEDLFYVNALSKRDLSYIQGSEDNYVKRGDYFELSNTRNLMIDLRYNEVGHVDLPESKMRTVPQDCDVERQFARATMSLGHNPIICGCHVLKLLRYSLKEYRPVWDEEVWSGQRPVLPMKVDIEGLTCWEPFAVRGKNVSEPETWAHQLLPLIGLCEIIEHP